MELAVTAAVGVAALAFWGIIRVIRARSSIREQLRRDGYLVLRMQRRLFSHGPFPETTRSQIAYRVVVRDVSGRDSAVWARWGRTWLAEPDRLEFRWERETHGPDGRSIAD